MTTYQIPEAARILGCSVGTVRKYISDGTIQNAYKYSGGWPGRAPWLIPEESLYDAITKLSKPKKKKETQKEKHIRGSKKMETKRIMAALDEMDEAIMQLHDAISKLRTELG